ncbi:MAG: VOC family protein [Gaiellaceae bacterium]
MAGQVVHVEWPAGDPDREQKFLEGLFGWEFEKMEGPIDYRMARTGEQSGVAVNASEADRGLMTYFDVDDMDAQLARVRELGGQNEEKMPVPGMGWFAHCRDPEGNAFGLWQTDESAPPPQG